MERRGYSRISRRSGVIDIKEEIGRGGDVVSCGAIDGANGVPVKAHGHHLEAGGHPF